MALPPYMTRPERIWHYTLLGICALVFLFLAAPILAMIPFSFNTEPYFTYPMPGVSLRWYSYVLTSAAWQRAATNSLIVAVGTTALAMLLGTLAALGLSRASGRLKQALMALLISPMIVPTVIAAIGMYFFFARLNLVSTYVGLIMAHTVVALPFVVITVTATLVGFDKNMYRAGASLGAGPVTVFRQIILPLIFPGFTAGAIFAFVTSFDEAVMVLFLAGPEQHTLPREMWKGVREEISPAILAVACLLVATSLLVLVLLEWVRRHNERLRGVRS